MQTTEKMMTAEDVKEFALSRVEAAKMTMLDGRQKQLLPTVDYVVHGSPDEVRARLKKLRIQSLADKENPGGVGAVLCFPAPPVPSFLLESHATVDAKFSRFLETARSAAALSKLGTRAEIDSKILDVYLRARGWHEKDLLAEIIRGFVVALEAYALVKVDEAYWIQRTAKTPEEARELREREPQNLKDASDRAEGILVTYETRTGGGFVRVPYIRERPGDESSRIVDFGPPTVIDQPVAEGRFAHLLHASVQ